MKYQIANELPGRLRVKLAGPVPPADLDALYRVLGSCPDIAKSTVYPRIGSVALTYNAAPGGRARVLEHLTGIDAAAIAKAKQGCGLELAPRSHSLLMDLASLVGFHFMRRWFLPAPLAAAWTVFSYRKFLFAGLKSLAAGRLDVPVLDAAAIGISFAKRDPRTAGLTMLLLNVGETLEEYTRSRSEGALINALLDLPETAQLVEGDTEVQVPSSSLRAGQLIAVRTGMPVCVDGTVVRGCAMVNQAALTGEPLAVERTVGDDVFAGTAVEDGEIIVEVKANEGQTKLRTIVNLVEQTESYKSRTQSRMERLADRIVPWNFLLAGIVALTTRSLVKTSAALMVDYSCALKLTGSIAVLSAMSQSAQAGFTVKGSQHFESMAQADVIVFDKTGTLTEAAPQVARVLSLDGWDDDEVLRFAACLEEHFPHPVARAVVRAAAEKGLEHRERHAEVEYIVAHGIASSLAGKRVVIGSEHFVVEDEQVEISEAQKDLIARETEGLSPLYLAVDGRLMGVIGVQDPLKAGVPEAIAELRRLGLSRVIMLTGDNERTAARIAGRAGVSEFHANLLPEDKYAFVEKLKAEGAHVVMVGDGVNDAPGLAQADVGLAIGAGTDIAIESADVVLMKSSLLDIPAAMDLSRAVLRNIKQNLFWAFFYNSIGIPVAAGVLYPALHLTLNPMLAAAAMSLSSVCVVSNALRLRGWKPPVFPDQPAPTAPLPESTVFQSQGKEENTVNKTIHIDGMMCTHCTGRVEKALNDLPGVEATVDLDSKSAAVTCTPDVSDDTLRQAVEDAGYHVTGIR